MTNPSPSRYGAIAKAFHWITAILVLIAFIVGPGGPERIVYAPTHDFDRQLHETLGLTVFALAILRALWQLIDKRPAPLPMARWMHIASKAVQGILYLLLFAVPLTAISGAWLEGHPLTLLAGIEIQPLLSLDHDLGKTIAKVHGLLGDVILWLAGLHAVAAIYHHAFLKDGVLLTMLPSWFPLRRRG